MDACLRLVEEFPRLLVVRTFSKIYGLSGLRAGYAVSSDSHLLAAVAPVLGINALTQAAVEYALRSGDAEIERRRARRGPRASGPDRPARASWASDVTDSQANFLWIRVRDMSGDQLANGLRKQGVISRPGRPAGRGQPRPRRDPGRGGVEPAAKRPGEPALGGDLEPDAGARPPVEDAPLSAIRSTNTRPHPDGVFPFVLRGASAGAAPFFLSGGAGLADEESQPVARAAAFQPDRAVRAHPPMEHGVGHQLRDEQEHVPLERRPAAPARAP